MADTVRNVMTRDPLCVEASTTISDAARQMRDRDVGDVVVLDGGRMCGIVTDRDIVVRALAEKRDPTATKVGDICSRDLVTVSPDDPVDRAVEVMRERSLRRLPVTEGGKPVGIVSIGDLAMDRDSRSALAQISAAPANR